MTLDIKVVAANLVSWVRNDGTTVSLGHLSHRNDVRLFFKTFYNSKNTERVV